MVVTNPGGSNGEQGDLVTTSDDRIATFAAVQAAAGRIRGVAHRTPVMTCATLDGLVGARVHLKCEHLQRSGAFKFRGACNAVAALGDRADAGVAAHSSGNHAGALALVARLRRVPCHVVMPSNTPTVKLRAVRDYGAEIILCEPTLEARATTLAEVIRRTGAAEVHPYDDVEVIAGQGTAALELLLDVPQIGAVMAPVSGGGLLAGTALAAHGTDPDRLVIGAEPANVDDAARSLAAGTLVGDRAGAGGGSSIADGLLATLSERTFAVIQTHVDHIVTVSETEIVAAMELLLTRTKQLIEPSGATAVAALLKLAASEGPPAADIGVVLSGGNVDLDRLSVLLPDQRSTTSEVP